MTPRKRRELTAAERAALQELVCLICPRDRVVIHQHQRPGQLITTIQGPDPLRQVRVEIERRRSVIWWILAGDSPVKTEAMPLATAGPGFAADAVNLIRSAVAWMLEEDIPPWPDLTRAWEWDDPAYGIRLESPRSPAERSTDGCGDDRTGKPDAAGRAGEGP